MYCSNCGHKNPSNGKFCEACGKPLDNVSKQVTSQSVKSPFQKFASIGGALVIICFFIPWLMASCSSGGYSAEYPEIKLSGWELATGRVNELDEFYDIAGAYYEYDLEDGSPALFLVPLMGIAGLFVLSDKPSSSLIATICGGVGVLILIIFGINVGNYKDELVSGTYGMISIRYQFGFYMTWLGFIIQTLAGVLKLL